MASEKLLLISKHLKTILFWEFCRSCLLKPGEQFSAHCYINELNLPETPFISRALRELLFQTYISFRSQGAVRKKKNNKNGGLKGDTAAVTFIFCFLLSPLVLLFLPCSFCLLGMDLVEKAFRMLGFDEKKDRWIVERCICLFSGFPR